MHVAHRHADGFAPSCRVLLARRSRVVHERTTRRESLTLSPRFAANESNRAVIGHTGWRDELAGEGSNLQPTDPKSVVLPIELPAIDAASRVMIVPALPEPCGQPYQ